MEKITITIDKNYKIVYDGGYNWMVVETRLPKNERTNKENVEVTCGYFSRLPSALEWLLEKIPGGTFKESVAQIEERFKMLHDIGMKETIPQMELEMEEVEKPKKTPPKPQTRSTKPRQTLRKRIERKIKNVSAH